jgi:DNA-binding transcriptional regulator YiaG
VQAQKKQETRETQKMEKVQTEQGEQDTQKKRKIRSDSLAGNPDTMDSIAPVSRIGWTKPSENIGLIRRMLHVTLEDLAMVTGRTRQAVHLWESGVTRPRDMAQQLLNGLHRAAQAIQYADLDRNAVDIAYAPCFDQGKCLLDLARASLLDDVAIEHFVKCVSRPTVSAENGQGVPTSSMPVSNMNNVSHRMHDKPTPERIIEIQTAAGWSDAEAANVLLPYLRDKMLQEWHYRQVKSGAFSMTEDQWELFVLFSGRHPHYRVTSKEN